jgi:hypothetical protein
MILNGFVICTFNCRSGLFPITSPQMAWFLRIALTTQINTICEVGFTTGHISALFLSLRHNVCECDTLFSEVCTSTLFGSLIFIFFLIGHCLFVDLFRHKSAVKVLSFLNTVYQNRFVFLSSHIFS